MLKNAIILPKYLHNWTKSSNFVHSNDKTEQKKWKLFYYRSRNDKEADFVLRQGNKVERIVQVCYDLSSPKTYKREQGALEETSEELKCKNLCVVTWDTEGDMEIDGIKAPIIPFEKWEMNLWVDKNSGMP